MNFLEIEIEGKIILANFNNNFKNKNKRTKNKHEIPTKKD